MEILLVLGIVLFLVALQVLGWTALWLGFGALAIVLLAKSGWARCPRCRRRPVALENVGFCNACGEAQPPTTNTRAATLGWTLASFALSLGAAVVALGQLNGLESSAPVAAVSIVCGVQALCFWALKATGRLVIRWRCGNCRSWLRNEWSLAFCGHCGTRLARRQSA